MKLTRRDILKLGGVTLIAAVGGSIFRAADQGMFSAGQGIAYEAWKNWREATNPLERIVAARPSPPSTSACTTWKNSSPSSTRLRLQSSPLAPPRKRPWS